MSRATQDTATPVRASRKGLSPATAALSSAFRSPSPCDIAVLQPRGCRDSPGLGSSPVARRYWGNHSYFLFLRVLRCFSSPRWPPQKGMAGIPPAGLSHSDTRGSKTACVSPRIFAACRVLHRLWEPRHPPCALACFVARDDIPRACRKRIGGTLPEFPATASGSFPISCLSWFLYSWFVVDSLYIMSWIARRPHRRQGGE